MSVLTRTQNPKSDSSRESPAGTRIAVGVGMLLLGMLLGTAGCGKALPFGSGDSNSTRTAVSTDENSLGAIYPVTLVIEASAMNWPAGDLPFTGPSNGLGVPSTDKQTQFQFIYTYPPNNFQLAEARLVLDTSKDNSDTEGIFVGGGVTNNGVFTGRPPNKNASSPKIQFSIAEGYSGGCTANVFFNKWAVDHYKRGEINTFDFSIAELLKSGGTCSNPVMSLVDLLDDGVLPVVTGDDTPVYQGFLVMSGYTISDEALSCSNSPTYTFENVFVHNDGNSTGNPFFNGTVHGPRDSQLNAFAAPQSVDMYFDADLPKVKLDNITITNAQLRLNLDRQAGGKAAIVINGVGIAESGFSADPDSPSATSEVEEWITDSAKVAAWESMVAALTPGGTNQAAAFDLLSLFGASKLRSLISQGNLNITVAGSLAKTYATGLSSARVPGTAIDGPEFVIEGTYFNKVCSVPDNPDSPLSGAAPEAPVCPESQAPTLSSVQAVEVTDTTAKIIWLTDEPGDSRVSYSTATAGDDDYTLTSPTTATDGTDAVFHEITLTNLNKYTIYFFRASTEDTCGNLTESKTYFFRTKR